MKIYNIEAYRYRALSNFYKVLRLTISSFPHLDVVQPMSSNKKPDSYRSHESIEVTCDQINFITRILNPQEAALKGIDIGDILSVRLSSSNSIEIVNASGHVCGVVASPDVDRLLKCIEIRNKYQAAVINIMNTLCDVRISYIS